MLQYYRTSIYDNVNELRKYLFAKRGGSIEHIPRTNDALVRHIHGEIYQDVFVPGMTTRRSYELPDPTASGWSKSEYDYKSNWMNKPEAAKACFELVHCKCKSRMQGPL